MWEVTWFERGIYATGPKTFIRHTFRSRLKAQREYDDIRSLDGIGPVEYSEVKIVQTQCPKQPLAQGRLT
jgi:hypothetical protein